MDRFTKEELEGVLAAMVVVAKDMGLTRGVAYVSIQSKQMNGPQEVHFLPVDNHFFRQPSGKGDKGTNNFGVAMEKLAVTMAHSGLDSGFAGLLPMKGENDYRGGLVWDFNNFYGHVGFSGAPTEDQDVEIARVGLGILIA